MRYPGGFPFNSYGVGRTRQGEPIPPRSPIRAAVDRPIASRNELKPTHRIDAQVVDSLAARAQLPTDIGQKRRSNCRIGNSRSGERSRPSTRRHL